MTDRELPSYEDLEPEGEASWGADVPSGDRAFEDDEFDEFMMGPLGEYEFEDPEDRAAFGEPEALPLEEMDDVDEFLEERHYQRPRSTLSTRAARTAFNWGRGARSAAAYTDNGRRPRAATLAQRPAQACSAAVREAQELMEALATAAATTEDEEEALGLVAAIVPISLGLAPNAYRALWPAIPALVRGAMGVTRLLHRQPPTHAHIRLLPKILQGATAQLAQHAARGSIIRQRDVAKVLADHTAAVLSRYRPSARRVRRSRHTRAHPYDPY